MQFHTQYLSRVLCLKRLEAPRECSKGSGSVQLLPVGLHAPFPKLPQHKRCQVGSESRSRVSNRPQFGLAQKLSPQNHELHELGSKFFRPEHLVSIGGWGAGGGIAHRLSSSARAPHPTNGKGFADPKDHGGVRMPQLGVTCQQTCASTAGGACVGSPAQVQERLPTIVKSSLEARPSRCRKAVRGDDGLNVIRSSRIVGSTGAQTSQA